MADARRMVAAQMSALIDGTFGCLDAAAEALHARLGRPVGKGTLSKRLAGQQGWPVDEVCALEDAAGRYPVTRMMARRLDAKGDTAAAHLVVLAGDISRETGEAVAAILTAQQSDCAGDDASAIAEIDEAIEVLRQARAKLEARR
ncbi:hypothetical protein KUV73_03985 [Mameliella alba]|nr:hypothetical protein [Mameliella alba]MBY6168486.1 hypothetical protein [Mameliella alba]MBY6173505.1 hypothetical protein [Mameliella alba]